MKTDVFTKKKKLLMRGIGLMHGIELVHGIEIMHGRAIDLRRHWEGKKPCSQYMKSYQKT